MFEELSILASGCVFGLAGGFTPGPTTTLVVAQTLRFGTIDGVKVAIAPLLTDAPIIAISVVLIGQLARFEPVLGAISLLGSAFLIYLAVAGYFSIPICSPFENLVGGCSVIAITAAPTPPITLMAKERW